MKICHEQTLHKIRKSNCNKHMENAFQEGNLAESIEMENALTFFSTFSF